MLVLDEASQLSTTDLAMISEAARQAGARVIATGDTAQLGAVEAGGMFRLLAQEVPAARLHEVRRFDAAWEREASVRLRDGDLAAAAAYDRHGRIRGADEEAACDRAAAMWLADHLRGKDVLLLAGSNAEAAGLSRRVQARLAQMGTRRPAAGPAVRRQPRRRRRPGPRPPQHRDRRRRPPAHQPRHAPDHRIPRPRRRGPAAAPGRDLDRDVPGPPVLPRSHAELAYAGNVHVAQGRTVDTAHLLVTDSLSRQALYVGMTRGRQSNTAHVVTGKTAPPGHQPYQQAAPEAVLAGVMQRDADDLSATEQIRQAQDWAGGTGHLLNLWSAAVRQTLHPEIDEQIKARLTESEAWRYDREHSRQALQQQAARRPARRTRHRRPDRPDHRRADGPGPVHLQRPARPPAAARPPAPAARRHLGPAHPRQRPAGRPRARRRPRRPARALGERMAASPEPWLARQLGVLAPGASPALREEYTRRAGLAAAYREAAGITNPEQAVSLEPHRSNPELEAMRKAVFTALEIRDEADIIRGLHRGELEARVLAGERAQAIAPPDVSSHCGSPRKPKPTPSSNPPTPRPNTTTPARPAPQPSPRSWPPNGSGSKPATPDTSNGPPTPTPPGKRPGKPQPNSNGADTPSPTANRSAAGRRAADDGRMVAPVRSRSPRPSNAPIARQHQAAIDAGQPWPPQRAPGQIAGPLRSQARRISRSMNPRRTTGQRG